MIENQVFSSEIIPQIVKRNQKIVEKRVQGGDAVLNFKNPFFKENSKSSLN
jgi:hypothetical protein